MAKVNPFEVAQRQLDQCAKILHLDPGMQAMLRVPTRELHVSIPVRMDDGSVKVFQGFRVQYNDAKGPCKGGIRFHPDETIDTVRALAAWMTWKCSLLDLPAGRRQGRRDLQPQGDVRRASWSGCAGATSTRSGGSSARRRTCRRRMSTPPRRSWPG